MSTSSLLYFFLAPTLAIARLGSGRTALDNFTIEHGPDGAPLIVPALTLDLDESGEIHAFTPRSIRFKAPNRAGTLAFRPVCPWFELWCAEADGSGGERHRPVTLEDFAGEDGGIRWDIEIANRKAHAVTRSPGDIVSTGRVDIAPDDHEAHALMAWSREAGTEHAPLVHAESPLPMGRLQVAKSHPDYGFRARFTPPEGHIYGPRDMVERLAQVAGDRPDVGPGAGPGPQALPAWSRLSILAPENREAHLILNPEASWSGCDSLPETEAPERVLDGLGRPVRVDGAVPPFRDAGVPPGLMDDTGDGIVGCSFHHGGRAWRICARLVVAPPDPEPAARAALTTADLLHDRLWLSLPPSGDQGTAELPDLDEAALRGEMQAILDALSAENATRAAHAPELLAQMVNVPPNPLTGQPATTNQPENVPQSRVGHGAAPAHLTRLQMAVLDQWTRRQEKEASAHDG